MPATPDGSSLRDQQRRHDWGLTLTIALAGLVTGLLAGFRWDVRSWLAIIAIVAFIYGLSQFYRHVRLIDDGRLAETLNELAILIACSAPIAALSYIVLAPGLPLLDAHFESIDRALGFDWPAWYQQVAARPALQQVLSAIYSTSVPHVMIVLLAAGIGGRPDRSRELNRVLLWSAAPVVLLSGLTPALSAWVHHGLGLEKAYHLAVISALREGGARELAVGKLLGIVTFPSYHTVMAVALIWASRGIAWLFWPTLPISLGVLISIPSEGGHYLVDMIAGAAITAVVILLNQVITARTRAAAGNGAEQTASVSISASASP